MQYCSTCSIFFVPRPILCNFIQPLPRRSRLAEKDSNSSLAGAPSALPIEPKSLTWVDVSTSRVSPTYTLDYDLAYSWSA